MLGQISFILINLNENLLIISAVTVYLIYSVYLLNSYSNQLSDTKKPVIYPSPSPAITLINNQRTTVNFQATMVFWLNNIRQSFGCSELKENEQLTKVAQERANYLFDSGTFEHDGYVETTKNIITGGL